MEPTGALLVSAGRHGWRCWVDLDLQRSDVHGQAWLCRPRDWFCPFHSPSSGGSGSPPPLPGLTPPPTLDDSGRGNRYLNGLQSSATATRSVLQSPKSPTAFDTPIKASSAPGTYLRSEALSYLPEDASLVAFREAEASLNRSLAGQEPLTPGHYHDLLSALVHVAHQGKASFEDAQRVLEHMRARGMAVDVPALLDNLVIEAHSCHGDVDIVATQVSLPVPLETRSFPTVTRYSWQRYVAFPDAWPAVLHPLTQCCSSQARGAPDSITIAAPVGRVIVGVIGVGTWGG